VSPVLDIIELPGKQVSLNNNHIVHNVVHNVSDAANGDANGAIIESVVINVRYVSHYSSTVTVGVREHKERKDSEICNAKCHEVASCDLVHSATELKVSLVAGGACNVSEVISSGLSEEVSADLVQVFSVVPDKHTTKGLFRALTLRNTNQSCPGFSSVL